MRVFRVCNIFRLAAAGCVSFLLVSTSHAASQPDITKPTTPANLVVSAPICSQVNLSWSASVDPLNKQSETVSGVKGYNIYRAGSFLKFVTTTVASDAILLGNTTYSYQVSAVDNANNESVLSASTGTRTPLCPDTTPPAVPGNLVVTGSGCDGATLSWAAASDASSLNQQVSGVKGYNVYRSGAFMVFTANLSVTDTGLSGNSDYTYQVSAVDNSNNVSGQSIAASIHTTVCPDNTAPSMPSGVTFTHVSCSEASLSWAPSVDPVNSSQQVSGLRGYNIYRNGSLLQFTTATTLTDGNVSADAVYIYRVSAIDNAGNESVPSAPLNANIPGCPAAQPA